MWTLGCRRTFLKEAQIPHFLQQHTGGIFHHDGGYSLRFADFTRADRFSLTACLFTRNCCDCLMLLGMVDCNILGAFGAQTSSQLASNIIQTATVCENYEQHCYEQNRAEGESIRV